MTNHTPSEGELEELERIAKAATPRRGFQRWTKEQLDFYDTFKAPTVLRLIAQARAGVRAQDGGGRAATRSQRSTVLWALHNALREQNPDIDLLGGTRVRLSGGVTPQTSGCVLDLAPLVDAVEAALSTPAAPKMSRLMENAERRIEEARSEIARGARPDGKRFELNPSSSPAASEGERQDPVKCPACTSRLPAPAGDEREEIAEADTEFKPFLEFIEYRDSDTLGGLAPDDTVIVTASGSWGEWKPLTLGNFRKLRDAILARRGAPAEGWRPTHRHVKRGTEYRLVDEADLQTDKPISDYEVVTIYRERNGRYWVRPSSEFEDGRFEELPPPPPSGDEERLNG